jgi:hypothetical protein
MNADDIDHDHANRLHVALFPGLNFLVRLLHRMEAKGFPPDDPLFKLVSAAYDWSHRLYMDLHYRSCSEAHQPTPKPSGDKGDLTDGDSVKTELRAEPHAVLPGAVTVELWHDGRFIGTVVGADGPGVRVITKHGIVAKPAPDDGSGIHVLEVGIATGG